VLQSTINSAEESLKNCQVAKALGAWPFLMGRAANPGRAAGRRWRSRLQPEGGRGGKRRVVLVLLMRVVCYGNAALAGLSSQHIIFLFCLSLCCLRGESQSQL